MRFGIVQRLDGDQSDAAFLCEALGVAARLAANEERDLLQFLLGLGSPLQSAAGSTIGTDGSAADAAVSLDAAGARCEGAAFP